MINSLTIQNFQSHKNTTLEFDNGINIIIGQSDSGKTAIIRALNWVINNRPTGEAFRSSWGGGTDVNLWVDKQAIRRGKGKTNFYNLQNLTSVAGEGDEKFLSFGQDVPDEIKNLVNFSSLNLQGQFDSPFLLALSGGEVARYLNSIVRLDVIDKSLYNIGSTLRKEKSDIEQAHNWLDTTKEKLEEFNWVDEAERCLVKLESTKDSLKYKKNKSFKLEFIINKISSLDKEIEQISKLTQHEDAVNKLITRSEKSKTDSNKVEKLSGMISNVNAIEESMERLAHKIKLWQRQFNKLMPDICPLCGRGE